MATKAKTKKSETNKENSMKTEQTEVETMENNQVIENNEVEESTEKPTRGRTKGVESKKYWISVEELNKLGRNRVQITGKQRQLYDLLLSDEVEL
jgi:hypothetical protein